jgi:selenocysteine lyase/cysteine desulfurase
MYASQPLTFGRSGLFEIPTDVTYLNAAFMTPLAVPVRQAGERAVAVKSAPWKLNRGSFYEGVERARAAAARLIGAQPGDVAIAASASYGVAVAAANLRARPHSVVLTMAGEHPSIVYVWLQRAKGSVGHEELQRPRFKDWTTAILERLEDRTRPRVGVLALTPVHWTDGSFIDLEAIAKIARRQGTALVVDATQSIGVQPFDVGRIKPDFVVFATYKWMLGPYGLAFLYAAPHRQGGRPIEESLFSRRGADQITNQYGRELRFMDGARRYDVGERANFVNIAMATAGAELLATVSAQAVADYLRPLTGRIADAATALGFEMPAPSARSAHILGIRRADVDASVVATQLARANIHVSARDGAIRISPYVYNDEADVLALIGRLREVVPAS